MRTSKNVSAELMERIWLLYKKGITINDISTVLSVSSATVHRAISIMKTAETGDVDKLNAMCGGAYVNQKQYAMRLFGIDNSKQQSNEVIENTAYCVAEIIKLLTHIDQNLVVLCNELGCNELGGNKR